VQQRTSRAYMFRSVVKTYKKKYYYWEFVILVRRLLIIFLTQLTSSNENNDYNFLLTIILFIFVLLHVGFSPFIYDLANNLDLLYLCLLLIANQVVNANSSLFISFIVFVCCLLPLCIVLYYIVIFIRLIIQSRKKKSSNADINPIDKNILVHQTSTQLEMLQVSLQSLPSSEAIIDNVNDKSEIDFVPFTQSEGVNNNIIINNNNNNEINNNNNDINNNNTNNSNLTNVESV